MIKRFYIYQLKKEVLYNIIQHNEVWKVISFKWPLLLAKQLKSSLNEALFCTDCGLPLSLLLSHFLENLI